MEYFLGSVITLVSLFIFNNMLKKITSETLRVPAFTQTAKVELLKNYLISVVTKKPEKETQSKNHLKKNSMKAFFLGKDVYWIESGFLFTAKVNENEIDESTKKIVDTHSIDKVELDKISFIVDKLTEGNKDDSGNSGK
jgi:hypothetical protein